MSNEPTKPAPATDEMRERAREFWGTFCGTGSEYADPKTLDIMAAFASQVLQQAEQRIAELEAWKESAISVMPPFQEIGRELDVRLGDSVHDKILHGIQGLKQRVEATERERDEARAELDSAVKMLRALNEETMLAGYPGGDRNQTLANVRAMRSAIWLSQPTPPGPVNDGWILASERLPEISGEYIAAFVSGTVSGNVHWNASLKVWGRNRDGSSWNVTHWRPLPTPPGTKGAE